MTVQILDPNVTEPNQEFSQAKRFRKLALEAGLTVTHKATRVLLPETRYASKTKDHNVGDLKSEPIERECLGLIAVSPDKQFAAWAFWEEQKLVIAKWGGPVYDPTENRIFRSAKITDVYQALQGFKGHWEVTE